MIYTSDQGMFLGEHDYIDKRWIYEEALRMPMLVSYPVEIPPDTVNDELVSNVDFAPTLLDYAGLQATDQMQGRSARASWRGEVGSAAGGEEDPAIYYRYWMHMTHHHNPAHYGIRTRRYKLIHFYGLPLDASGALPFSTPPGWELYDLEKDPFEDENVIDDPDNAEIVADLKDRLRTLKIELGDPDDRYPEMLTLPSVL